LLRDRSVVEASGTQRADALHQALIVGEIGVAVERRMDR